MVLWFSATLFLSSTLLFLVQPMVGRMILPALGGTPAVWNTCMVFFQAALLAGYAYAHVSVRWFGVRRQVIIHLVLLLTPLLVLPIRFAQGPAPPTDSDPTPWLLGQLLIYVGLPFFLVSTSAPLLQRWFVGTGHPDARDPYFLYAAGNLGSLLALLGYPLLFEPVLGLTGQSQAWTVGYGLLVVMTVGCAIAVGRAPVADGIAEFTQPDDAVRDYPEVTTGLRLWWILLAFVPSSLMLGVTTFITTDIASVPLLWVLPLATYLLTFVFVFARKQPLSLKTMSLTLPAILPLWLTTLLTLKAWVVVPIHLLLFFIVAMVCHGRLAESRPAPRRLTEFYLCMSIGGVLGGLFNAIVAPLVFSRVIEYPLMLVLACLLKPPLPGHSAARRDRRLDMALPAALGLVMIAVVRSAGLIEGAGEYVIRGMLFLLLPIACFLFRKRPLRFGLGFAVFVLTMGYFMEVRSGTTLHIERNFFGVKRVRLDRTGLFRELVHGNTSHGLQSVDPARSREPFAYYHRNGPLGDVFATVGRSDRAQNVAIVGLGTGAMAAYAEPGQRFTFYEVDPAVVRLARNPEYFSFLSECRGACNVVVGDGRLMLADVPDKTYQLIILDAFSSDSIPTHLVNRESFRLYMSKLDDSGVLVCHISNRFLVLAPLLGSLARDAGLVCVARRHRLDSSAQLTGRFPSEYAVLARSPKQLAELTENPEWRLVPPDPGTAVWTDEYTNILSVFRWR